jgi:hypothetical protein
MDFSLSLLHHQIPSNYVVAGLAGAENYPLRGLALLLGQT